MAQQTSTRMILNYIRRGLEYEVRTEYFSTIANNTNAPANVWLKGTPIDLTQPFTVTYSPYGHFTDTDPLTADQYAVNTSSGKLELFLRTIVSGRGVKVTYTSGYPEIMEEDGVTGTGVLDVPQWLRMAAANQAAFIYKSVIEGTAGQNEKLSGAEKIALNILTLGTLQPSIKASVSSLRKVMVGR